MCFLNSKMLSRPLFVDYESNIYVKKIVKVRSLSLPKFTFTPISIPLICISFWLSLRLLSQLGLHLFHFSLQPSYLRTKRKKNPTHLLRARVVVCFNKTIEAFVLALFPKRLIFVSFGQRFFFANCAIIGDRRAFVLQVSLKRFFSSVVSFDCALKRTFSCGVV